MDTMFMARFNDYVRLLTAFNEAGTQLAALVTDLASVARAYDNGTLNKGAKAVAVALDTCERARGVLEHHLDMHCCQHTFSSSEGRRTRPKPDFLGENSHLLNVRLLVSDCKSKYVT